MERHRLPSAAMPLRPIALLLAAAALAGAAAARAGTWRPVPGAPDVEVDLASLQQQRTRALAWVRWWGRSALVPELAAAPRLRIHRTAVLVEFDCAGRTLRGLAAHGYDGNGTPVFMSSVPGPVRPVRGQELEWTYDAVCEAARTGGRG